jgi:stage V sporulation protein R
MEEKDLARLKKIEERLCEMAREEGLVFCDIEWDIIPDQKMFEIMAYRIPGNISNWKYGRDYERIRTINEQVHDGLPLEVVINSDPSRAYLMKSNTIGQQILVIAHVIGHVAFFTMNKFFQETRKDIIQVMDAANKRFTKYEQNYGIDEVEAIVDAGHALQLHSSPFDTEIELVKKARVFEMERRKMNRVKKSEFADVLESDDEADKMKTDINLYNMKLKRLIDQRTPVEPAADLLRYVIDHSVSLEEWQKDILEILRIEGQYFWPQMKTKYMNEGFASFWHERLVKRLYEEDMITDLEYAEFNYSNSLVQAMSKTSMNPYLIGCDMWKDIVERWDKGLHGREYDDCEDYKIKEKWDTKAGAGIQKMFDIVETYTDWFFMQDFLTPELIDKLKMYIFVVKDNYQSIDVVRTKHDFDQIRELIVASFAHSHIPQVEIVNINYKDAGVLMLKHKWAGSDLLMKYAIETLKHLHRVWGRPVILETVINKTKVFMVAEDHNKDPKIEERGKVDDPDGKQPATLDMVSNCTSRYTSNMI